MPTITIRHLSTTCHQRLRERAAENGHSMEAEARLILDDAVAPPARTLTQALMEFGLANGGITLDLPARTDSPQGATF